MYLLTIFLQAVLIEEQRPIFSFEKVCLILLSIAYFNEPSEPSFICNKTS